jgi:pyruvate dehydrogenase E1 component alpha subunit
MAVGVGAGLTIRKNKTDNMVYVFFGDGTANRGAVYEAINLASVWKLPVLFICENNQFAISTHVSEASPVKNPGADRAAAYGIPSKIVDGTDVLDVYEGARELEEYVRSGNGPAILEAKSYRWRGHFEGDQMKYRDASVTEEWMKKDCVEKLEKYLLENNLITKDEITKVREDINAELDKAIEFAEASPATPAEEIYDYLYVK